MSNLLPCFITCAKNLEGLLKEELLALKIPSVKETVAGVYCEGTLEQLYLICLESRIANHVLLKLSEFPLHQAQDLYEHMMQIDWSEHLDAEGSFCIEVTGTHEAFVNTLFAGQRAKDAIADQFREKTGVRPSVKTHQPDIVLNIHLHHDRTTVSLSLSGESLHRRGYRKNIGAAPLKETLAAALLIRAGWPLRLKDPNPTLWDPFCGSGTLILEAAFMAFDIAPGLLRNYFGFLGWKGHQTLIWEQLIDAAKARAERGLEREDVLLLGSDVDRQAIDNTRENADLSGLQDYIALKVLDARQLTCPEGVTPGLIITNPPYGERMNPDDLDGLSDLFEAFGQSLKSHFTGWSLALFSGAPKACLQAINIRPQHQYAFWNGTLPCKLYRFELTADWFITRESPLERREREITKQQTEPLSLDAQMFENRLLKNYKHLQKWAKRENISCFRLYDADLPNYAVAIDFYEGKWLQVQEYQAPKTIDPQVSHQRLLEVLQVLEKALHMPQTQIFLKVRKVQKGSSQYEKIKNHEQFYEIQEGPAKFWVNFEDYLDTGIFLDHRLVRARIAQASQGKSLLNLFAYTGTASVLAALNGAKSIVTVDLSKTYLDWCHGNFVLNQLDHFPHQLIQADCLEWISEDTHYYDVIFLNPPAFSNSKRMDTPWDVAQDHADFIVKTAARLKPQGVLFFSCNLKNFKLDLAKLDSLDIQDISKPTLSLDFARDENRHHVFEIRQKN